MIQIVGTGGGPDLVQKTGSRQPQPSPRSSRFAAGDPYLDTDAVFGVKRSLIAPFVEIDGNGETVAELDFDFVLVPAEKRLRTDSATSLGM